MWGRVPARGPRGALSGAGLTVSTQGLFESGRKVGGGKMGKGSQQVLGECWLHPPGTLAQEQGWGHEARPVLSWQPWAEPVPSSGVGGRGHWVVSGSDTGL